MEEKARMVAAARRRARRIARTTDMTYQQALDHVARGLGRDHWAHYASDPVPVPRDEATSRPPTGMERQVEFMRAVLNPPSPHLGTVRRTVPRMQERERVMLSGEDWNMPLEARLPILGSAFLPGWNALADAFVGPRVADGDRERHVERIAEILIPSSDGRVGYFAHRGRLALVGFLLAEVARSWFEGRSASIPAMLEWIGASRRDASLAHAAGGDGTRAFLTEMMQSVRGDVRFGRAFVEIAPLVDMSPNERAGVLGTMDQGLLPFRSWEVAEANR